MLTRTKFVIGAIAIHAAILAIPVGAKAAIDLGYTDGHLSSVYSTEEWGVSYYVGGQYYLSNSEAPGNYLASALPSTPQFTSVITDALNTNVSTPQAGLYVFDPAPAMATPEASTWMMMFVGLASLAMVGRRRARIGINPIAD